MKPTCLRPLLLVLWLVVAGACTRKIGDSCTLNVECSPQGDRYCDIAAPLGYCTVDNCDYNTCPDGAACVRFFSLMTNSGLCRGGLAARPDCPADTDAAQACCRPGTPGCCLSGQRCLCQDAACQRAYCATDTSERRWCMQACESDGDCREGYRCYQTGQNGSEAIPYRDESGVLIRNPPGLRFCASAPVSR